MILTFVGYFSCLFAAIICALKGRTLILKCSNWSGSTVSLLNAAV